MFVTPFALSHSTTHCRSGFPPTFTSPFGKSAVIGLSRITLAARQNHRGSRQMGGPWQSRYRTAFLQTGYKRSTLMHRRWRTAVREIAEKQFFEKEFLFFSRFGNRSFDFLDGGQCK